jgi:hypothetical protein
MAVSDSPPFEPPVGAPPNLARELAAMPADSRDLLIGLRDEPTPALMEELQSNSHHWEQLARIDSRPWLVSWFTPTIDWHPTLEGAPPIGGPIGGSGWVGTVWSFGGRHDISDVFNGLPATGRDIVVRGFTLMGVVDEAGVPRFRLRRFIDWIGVFSQLGLSVDWRVPVPNTRVG